VPAFLVTGNPGSGKSALARELAGRGVPAIDPDDDPELAHWEDAAGQRVTGPPRPDGQWLRSHRWVWSRSRMEQVLAGHARAVFVCGIARNQDKMLDLFETQMLRAGAVALDGTAPTAAVADELLALADSWPVFGQG
jgi:hypothetical protein